MIVVVGSPRAEPGNGAIRATGFPVFVAGAAAVAGGDVEVVGRVGDDPTGDALLLDLAARGVGHVAVLRTGGAATPIAGTSSPADERAPAAVAFDETGAGRSHDQDGLPMDPGDLELALRYLPDYRVVVVAARLEPTALGTVASAAGWAGARLILVVDGVEDGGDLPADATILERPAGGDDDAFAAVVARYAVELDRGSDPADAFAMAATRAGWTTVSD